MSCASGGTWKACLVGNGSGYEVGSRKLLLQANWLVGSICKIASKLLANRIYEVVSSVTGLSQGAFVKGAKSVMESW